MTYSYGELDFLEFLYLSSLFNNETLFWYRLRSTVSRTLTFSVNPFSRTCIKIVFSDTSARKFIDPREHKHERPAKPATSHLCSRGLVKYFAHVSKDIFGNSAQNTASRNR